MKTPKQATIVLVLAASMIAVACGSSSAPPSDAGSGGDAQPDAYEAGAVDASQDASAPADADAADPLEISPPNPSATGCSTTTVTFTASGGTPPYAWSTNDTASSDLVVIGATQATWEDNADDFCGTGGSISVTVTDSVGATATAVIAVTGG